MVGSFSGCSRYLQSMQSARDLVAWIAAADRQGVRILSTPEAYIGGYPLWNAVEQTLDMAGNEKRRTAFVNGAIDLHGPELRLIRDAARTHDVAVVVGANLRGEDANRNHVYNAVIFVSEIGEIVGLHRKTSPSHTEREYWAFGEATSIKPVTLQGLRIMAVQCWEARNPLTVSQIALEAPDVVFLPTADGLHPEVGGEYLVEMRYIGRNSHSYVLSSTTMFDWTELESAHEELAIAWRKFMPGLSMLGYGGAAAVDPTGRVVDVTRVFETRLVTVMVDTENIRDSMAIHSVTDDYRLKGEYTLYAGGKKLSGNGPDSIY